MSWLYSIYSSQAIWGLNYLNFIDYSLIYQDLSQFVLFWAHLEVFRGPLVFFEAPRPKNP